MIVVSSFKGRKVALFGLGGSGLVTARALLAGGAQVIAWDDNPVSVEKAKAEGITTRDLHQQDFSTFAALVLAPGVPLTHPSPHWTVELAHQAGIEIIGDIELFSRALAARNRAAPLVAITGTNGKSTTTALIAHVFKQAGRDVQMGGNIGRAVLDLDPISKDNPANQVFVVECSSYQIDLAPSLNPHVGLLLNISPDHLERHGTLENYAAIKETLVARSDVPVVGMDDDFCRVIVDRLIAREKPLVRISSHAGKNIDVGFDGTNLLDAAGKKLATLENIGSLRGVHNGQNAALAYAACEALGLSDEEIQRGFDTFPGLEHRMEQVGHVGNILFVNDSKATNAEAVAPAISSFDQVHWILGGLAKDGGIESLKPHFDKVAKAYLIGESAPQFAAQLGDSVAYEISDTLDVAVVNAAADAAKTGVGEVVLLSPAAASFDQFPNFEKRGEAFKLAVAELKNFQTIERLI